MMGGRLVKQGLAHYNAGRFAAALEDFKRALAAGEKSTELMGFIGHCLVSLGKTREAEKSFREAIRVRREDVRSYIGLAQVLKLTNRTAASESVLRKAMGLRRGRAEAAQRLSALLRESAMKKCAEGRLNEAMGLWKRLLALDRSNEEARRELGEVLRKLAKLEQDAGRWRRAEALMRDFLRLEPASEERRRELGEVLRARARAYKAKGHMRESEKLLGRAGRLAEADAAERGDRFRSLVALGKYAEAIAEGERILDAGPTLADMRVFWHPWDAARFENIRERHARALDGLIEKGRGGPWAHYFRGILRDRPSDFRDLKRFPARRYGWMNGRAGHLNLMHQDFEEAVRRLRLALRWKPVDWRLRGFLAEALLCLHRTREAFAELDRARGEAPEEEGAQVLAWRGALDLWLGRYPKALRELDLACRLGALWAFCWRGAAKLKLGRPREALPDFEKAIELYPRDREAVLWRGEALRELGLYRQALKDLSAEPVGMWALINRALVKAALKDYNGMARDFESVPRQVVDYVTGRIGQGVKEELTAAQKARVLEAALTLARGYRHLAVYGNAIWMA